MTPNRVQVTVARNREAPTLVFDREYASLPTLLSVLADADVARAAFPRVGLSPGDRIEVAVKLLVGGA